MHQFLIIGKPKPMCFVMLLREKNGKNKFFIVKNKIFYFIHKKIITKEFFFFWQELWELVKNKNNGKKKPNRKCLIMNL
jgi:hypothetical protein